MSDKKTQRAGDNSTQLQAQTINITAGITEERARKIFNEMFLQERNNLTAEAYQKANDRIDKFENYLIPKMEKIAGSFNAFSDPDFQMALREAHKTAVRTDRDVDYNLLSELLLRRIEHGEDRHIRAGLDKAAEIVDDISDEGLEGLTVAYAIESYIPVTGYIKTGLKTLDDLFSKLLDNNSLPTDDEWLDHLDILDAVRVSSLGSLKKLREFYSEIMDGYVAVGILKDSDEYNKVVEILNKVGLLEQGFFVDNELIDGYVRIPISNHGHIPDISVVMKESDGSLKTDKAYKLNDEQVKALKNVFNLYDKDASKISSVKEKFMAELRNYPTLKRVEEWWNSIPHSFSITSAGRVLAYANAKRLNSDLPDLL